MLYSRLKLYLRRAGIAAIFLHLFFVTWGAAHFKFLPSRYLSGGIFGAYTELSGARSVYGFFAPGIGTQVRATYELTTQGRQVSSILEEGGRESELRMQNIVSLFRHEKLDKKLKRSITASWAGKAFARYADAKEVVVRVDAYDLPSSQEYLSGKRPQWEKIYQANFARSGSAEETL